MIFFVGLHSTRNSSSHRDQTCIFSVTYFMFLQIELLSSRSPPELEHFVNTWGANPEIPYACRNQPRSPIDESETNTRAKLPPTLTAVDSFTGCGRLRPTASRNVLLGRHPRQLASLLDKMTPLQSLERSIWAMNFAFLANSTVSMRTQRNTLICDLGSVGRNRRNMCEFKLKCGPRSRWAVRMQ